MNKLRITKRQKKILMIVGVVTFAFVVFILFIYLPSQRELIRLKNEYYKTESEIMNIKRSAGEGKSLEENIGLLKKKFDALNNKFPAKEEVILRALSEAAAKCDIEVMNLKPHRKRVIQEIGSISIKMKDSYVQEMSVAMSLKGSYRRLGEFFRYLKEDLPVFARVDDVRLAKRSDDISGLLEAEVDLNTYLICPEVK